MQNWNSSKAVAIASVHHNNSTLPKTPVDLYNCTHSGTPCNSDPSGNGLSLLIRMWNILLFPVKVIDEVPTE